VEVRGALEKATLADVARYRDEHLVIPDRVMFCSAGGVPPEKLRSAVDERLGKI
jgi:hypothetical protein